MEVRDERRGWKKKGIEDNLLVYILANTHLRFVPDGQAKLGENILKKIFGGDLPGDLS